MMRSLASAVVTVALAALPAFAAPGDGQAPPPASLDAKGIDDWRRAHIDAKGYALMHADGVALSYAAAPGGLAPDADGFLRVDVRREYYRSVRVGPQPSRSNLQTWIVDCELRRVRITAMNFYPLNNLRGAGFRKASDGVAWTTVEPNSDNSQVFDRICAGRPAAAP